MKQKHQRKKKPTRVKVIFIALPLLLGILLFPRPAAAARALQELGTKARSTLDSFDSKVDRLMKPYYFNDSRVRVKFGGQSRYRVEYRDDFNLNDRTYEDDVVHLIRNRLNMEMAYFSDSGATPLKLFAEGQEAHSFASSNVNQTAAFENRLDLRQLFAEVKSPWEEVPLTAKVGRQVLSYGEERFVGGFDWSNVSRVFDAVKLVYNPSPRLQLDMFFSQVVLVNKDKADSADHEDNFYGIYLSTRPFREHMDQILDSFLFIRNDKDEDLRGEIPGQTGPLKEYTFGNRFKGKKWNFDYGTEYAVQLGSRAHNQIQAWAFHQDLGYTFVDIPWTPRIYSEYNHASGDRNPRRGNKFNTFDNLFPTNHNKYGHIDFISLKNMNNFMMGASVKPHQRWLFSTDFHWFFLDAKESPWFNAGGGVYRAANPRASTQLGEEVDIMVNYKCTEHLSFLGGYSHFFAGPFAKDTGANDDANFLYLQTVFNF